METSTSTEEAILGVKGRAAQRGAVLTTDETEVPRAKHSWVRMS